MAGNNGAKNKPNQTIPWLLIIWSTFSATLNSPYSGYKITAYKIKILINKFFDYININFKFSN